MARDKIALIGAGQIGGRWEASEQGRRHLIDARVGALGGENRSHQELDWRSVTERGARFGKGLAQLPDDEAGSTFQLLAGFAPHALRFRRGRLLLPP